MTPRTGAARWVWWLLWFSWIGFCVQLVVSVLRFDGPWQLAMLRVLPLLLFMPSVTQDNLRAVIWLCFVTLFYFIFAVEWVFAQPGALVPTVGLVLVVVLFSSAVAYIRLRGRQVRLSQAAVSQGGESHG